MSQTFDCRYTDGNRNVVRLGADLSLGWQDLGDAWGFDSSGILHYEIQSDFHCRLRLVAQASEMSEARTKPPVLDYLTQSTIGNNAVMIFGSRLMVGIPLDQPWRPAEYEPHPPSIHEIEPSIFSLETPEGAISYQLEVWIALHGITKKFAANEYEWGNGFAWLGSPPEAGQQKVLQELSQLGRSLP